MPLVGALLAFVVRGRAGQQIGMAAALVTLALGLVVFFVAGNADLGEQISWIPQIGAGMP